MLIPIPFYPFLIYIPLPAPTPERILLPDGTYGWK